MNKIKFSNLIKDQNIKNKLYKAFYYLNKQKQITISVNNEIYKIVEVSRKKIRKQ